MNIEAFYVRAEDQKPILAAVEARLRSGESDKAGSQSDAALPSSYDPLLRTDPKRKVVVSPAQGGWVAVVEAKEVVDFELAKQLSQEMQTVVLVVQLSEVVGATGKAIFKGGEVVMAEFDEEDDDPSGSIENFMSLHGVIGPLPMFREVVRLQDEGWCAVSRT